MVILSPNSDEEYFIKEFEDHNSYIERMEKRMKAGNLKPLYERIYEQGKQTFFSFSTSDVSRMVCEEIDYAGMNVLEIGCGTGETAALIANAGASHVVATDFSENAIRIAQETFILNNLSFSVSSIDDIEGEYDCIVMQEVIEHTDDPFQTIAVLAEHIKKAGHLIITCPSFINLRGIVWMTLQILLDVPMSLSDKHFISPFDMEEWANQLNLALEWRTFRFSQAFGDDMITDMTKRLTNALSDANLDNTKVDRLLQWLRNASRYCREDYYNGAKALYHFRSQF